MTLYYLYDKDGFYTGKTQESDKPVENGFPFAPEGKSTAPGYVPWFDGVGWIPAPDVLSDNLTLEQAQQRVYDMLAGVYFPQKFEGDYSAVERSTFDAQYAEAQAVEIGKNAGPYLTAISSATGEDVKSLATKVLAKRQAYDQALASFAAKAQALRNQTKAAKTKKDLPTYVDVMKLKQTT